MFSRKKFGMSIGLAAAGCLALALIIHVGMAHPAREDGAVMIVTRIDPTSGPIYTI